jgi:hypothetical protein
MNADRRRLASQPPSKSKRWATTMKTSMEEANNLRGPNDRDQMIQGLAERKLANTKTSISFGNEKVRLGAKNYTESTYISNQGRMHHHGSIPNKRLKKYSMIC